MDQNHEVDVLTINPYPGFGSYISGSEKDIPRELNVFRTFPGLIHYMQYGVLSRYADTKSSNNDVFVCPTQYSKKNKIKGIFRKCIYYLWRKVIFNLLIPDQFIDWLLIGGLKGIRLMYKNRYDCVISSGRPVTDHLVAYFIKRIFPRTTWVAEYGDPWSFFHYPPKPRLIKEIHVAIERPVLKRVDQIVVMTEETRIGFLKHFPFLRPEQVKTIPQGCDTKLIESITPYKNTRFTLGYIGRFDIIRDPKSLFESLKLLREQNVEYEYLNVGLLQDYYRKIIEELNLNGNVKILGQKPHIEALHIAKSCDVLIYWGNKSSYQLPSKIWEYIALRKPILCATFTEKDIGAKIVREYNRGIIVPCEPEKITHAISLLRNLWLENRLESVFNLSYIEQVDWRQRAGEFNELVLSLKGV